MFDLDFENVVFPQWLRERAAGLDDEQKEKLEKMVFAAAEGGEKYYIILRSGVTEAEYDFFLKNIKGLKKHIKFLREKYYIICARISVLKALEKNSRLALDFLKLTMEKSIDVSSKSDNFKIKISFVDKV